MKAPSNNLRTLRFFYHKQLQPIYGDTESTELLLILIKHFFGFDRTKLALQNDLRLSESEMLKLHFAVKDLLQQKPVQYITKTVDFLGNSFKITPGVLIPRPETEQLVDILIKRFSKRSKLNIWDLGTGSGCIAISLALALPGSKVAAFDLSEEAIDLTKENAKLLNANINIQKADILKQDFLKIPEKIDLLVSNPPYVRHSERKYMKPNVLNFEPELALFVPDDDPLVFYKAITKTATKVLAMGGELWFEINEALGNETTNICWEAGLKEVQLHQDIHGRDRFVSALKK